MDKPEIKVGDTYYIFDGNYRVYPERKKGEYDSRSPIYREHFRPVTIMSETTRSWICGPKWKKISKRDPWKILNTPSMVDDDVWMNNNRYQISKKVHTNTDVDKLRQIAEIIGYEE